VTYACADSAEVPVGGNVRWKNSRTSRLPRICCRLAKTASTGRIEIFFFSFPSFYFIFIFLFFGDSGAIFGRTTLNAEEMYAEFLKEQGVRAWETGRSL
jgi:hypothetical protein